MIFDNETTGFMLGYIRKNIYKNYPYKKLNNSSLLPNFRFERATEDIKYIHAGTGSRIKIPYEWSGKHRLFFKDNIIAEISNLEIKAFTSKCNKEYLDLRNEQSKVFK